MSNRISNKESQENEILALRSIFEKKEFIIFEGYSTDGRIAADVRLPDGFYVKRELSSAVEEIFYVDHLPPITLIFRLPDTYPLKTWPAFLLSCSWLSLQQLSILCKQLEKLWEMNMDAILYTWMQFLKEDALGFLKISQCLDISEILTFKRRDNFSHRETDDPDYYGGGVPSGERLPMHVMPTVSGGNRAFDLRAINELSDGEMIIQILKDYNEKQKESIFCASIQDCNVCFLRKLGSEFIKFNSCKHFFCKNCVKEYFEELIKEGNVFLLKCLQGECDSQLDVSTLKGLVEPNLFERYDKLLLSATLDCMSDIAYCPRQDCQCACIIDTCGRIATCNACRFVFCPFCKMTSHGVAPCNFKSLQQKRIFEKYINGNSSEKGELEKRYGRRVLNNLVEETLSESWKSSNTKSCPHCRASIEKTEGCNKITCFKCGLCFCWLCMQKLKSSNPYSHYSDRDSECYNMLFPGGYLDQFEEEAPHLDIYERAMFDGHGNAIAPGQYLNNGYEIIW